MNDRIIAGMAWRDTFIVVDDMGNLWQWKYRLGEWGWHLIGRVDRD